MVTTGLHIPETKQNFLLCSHCMSSRHWWWYRRRWGGSSVPCLLTGTQADGGATVWNTPGCSSMDERKLEVSHWHWNSLVGKWHTWLLPTTHWPVLASWSHQTAKWVGKCKPLTLKRWKELNMGEVSIRNVLPQGSISYLRGKKWGQRSQATFTNPRWSQYWEPSSLNSLHQVQGSGHPHHPSCFSRALLKWQLTQKTDSMGI